MRGRLFLAGVDEDTPVGDVLDVLTVVVMDCPGEALQKWRSGLDRAISVATAREPRATERRALDRASWGLQPDQIESTRRFMSSMGGG